MNNSTSCSICCVYLVATIACISGVVCSSGSTLEVVPSAPPAFDISLVGDSWFTALIPLAVPERFEPVMKLNKAPNPWTGRRVQPVARSRC